MSNKTRVFALVDCNNFFVSCERIFRPDLEDKPLVVLSSNDGCVVSRSNEAKTAGVPMGAPAFQYRRLFKEQGITQFSANFELYGDISRRIIDIIASITPRTEVYSVDESFLDLSELNIIDYNDWGKKLRKHILRTVGVPVSIGIAPTKTLAKLGADYAKTDASLNGALSLVGLNIAEHQSYLKNFPLEDIWGVGRRLAPRLHAEGIHSALDLSRLRPRLARQIMGLLGLQMVSELNGISCHGLGPLLKPPKTIMRSRTFGEDTHQFDVLESAITSLAARAALQARNDQQLARKALLFLSTSRHKPGYKSWYEIVNFSTPTNDGGHIGSALICRLSDIYNNRQAYHRAGVTLCDFVPIKVLQIDLLGNISWQAHDTSQALMQAVDAINIRYGRHRIYYAAEDLNKSWQPKQSSRSPRYVSNWNELPKVQVLA